jgi:DNA-binding LytR/AlgR family response regulator
MAVIFTFFILFTLSLLQYIPSVFRLQPLEPQNLPIREKGLPKVSERSRIRIKGGMTVKCTVIIDENREEEVVVYAHARTSQVEKIESLVKESVPLMGYGDDAVVPLQSEELLCVFVEAGKVYAMTLNDKWQLKGRLYQVEELLPSSFVKINQSCLANIRKIQRFQSTIGGTLQVVFENGYVDYVSRRQLKTVKERMGL